MANQKQEKKPDSDFLSTDRGSTQSNAIEIPSISLPKGGGALKGIDEKFSVNAVNGTSSFSIPLPFAPARGAAPSLTLSYSSGAGNGVFGLGWNLSLGKIKRKTDKELPQYIDSIDSDTYLLSEAEDLVPEFSKLPDGSFEIDGDGEYIVHEKSSPDNLHLIRFYRPRIEGLFARIERWTEKINGRIRWRILSRQNSTTLYGWTDNAILVDPNDPLKIYEWLPEFLFDDKGNCAHYIYKEEDNLGLDESLLHNRNRIEAGNLTYTNRYLEKVFYSNKTPYAKFGDPFPPASDYMFETVLDYGTTDMAAEPADQVNPWDFRADAFSEYRSGFEIRTTRLCKRVLLFHIFEELAFQPDKSDSRTLIRSLNFGYDTAAEQDFTFLKSVTSYGYIKKEDGTYAHKTLPPFEFEYQKHDWNSEVKTISAENLVHAPLGLEEAPYQFVDLFNEGIAGVLTEQANGWYYKHNLGDGVFAQAKLISPKPSFIGLGSRLQLADLDADGGKQLVNYTQQPKGYFELTDDNNWDGFRSFTNLPNIDFKDPHSRMLDLNGDGKPEILIAKDQVFTWYSSEGRMGFAPARNSQKPFDEEAGPHMVFADQKETIFLADMSGDGLTDILRIRNGEVCYWPNLGYGNFGAKVAMDNAPVFDHPEAFNPAFIRLADIDGSGTSDIIYLGKRKFSCWKNLSGNRFGTVPFEIDPFPQYHAQAKVTVADILGNGVACIVWSSPLAKDSNTPLKYIDLMNSKKPHILVSYKNNFGKVVSLEYTASTRFYLEDKAAGKPWITKLHFPVHCVTRSITEDKISGYKFISDYKYHHGYYDHPEGEFRGFGLVEQTDAETYDHWIKQDASNIVEEPLHQEPVVLKSWYHTGAFLRNEKILQQFSHEYWYAEMARQGFVVAHPEIELPEARLVVAPGLDPSLLDNLSSMEWQQALRTCKGMPLRTESFARDAIKFGNTPEAIQKELTPFSVATHNCLIELLQPKGKNKYAVFVVKENEAITYNYERNTEDPRIAHNINIQMDEYGNVLEAVSIVYPRANPDLLLPLETRQAQARTLITYTHSLYTNDVIQDDNYRLRLSSEVRNYELTGVEKTGTFYTPEDFEDILSDLWSDNAFYHEYDKAPAPGRAQRRVIEHIRSTYYRNDLTGPLPLHQMDSLALPYESFQLAYTPELITDIFGAKVNAALLTEGKYTHSEGDNNWWIRSGRTQYIELAETVTDAQNRFYNAISYTDPFGAVTRVRYYGNYHMFLHETEDVFGNKSTAERINFRTLSASRMKDMNGNFSEIISDELGMVKALALMGKGNEADELIGHSEITSLVDEARILSFFQAPDSVQLTTIAKQLLLNASTRFVYDLDAYRLTGDPVSVATIVREQHFSQLPDSPVQISFEYTNGTGEMVMKKSQAEPGRARQVTINPDHSTIVVEVDTSAMAPKQLRWIGNGRTVRNNKGKAVKQYEPYFSITWNYEDHKELVETGVTPILFYDAPGRMIRTELPNGTFSKQEFDSWKQSVYDTNDTILESTWYLNRTNRLIDAELLAAGKDPGREKLAADATVKHANTPNSLHFDTLGRPILSVEHNKNLVTNADEFQQTRVLLDVEGNLRQVTDARGNTVVAYKYDMLGNIVFQDSMDAGRRWLLQNIMANPLRTWDERNQEFQYFYDIAHRSVHGKVKGGDGDELLDHIFDRTIYGESLLLPGRTNEAALQARNCLGKIIGHYDTAGLVETPDYDFKGQPLFNTRKLFRKYKEVANWTDANLIPDLEAGPGYTFTTETDALGRITRQIAPDGSIISPAYNETGLLNGESVLLPGDAMASEYIKDIDYNEKGQREKIVYGNDVSTRYYFDRETLRLNRLESKRINGDPLQDWYYTYDPVGNITHLEDKNIPVVFFNNQKTSGLSTYTYDPLYRLVEATGRENNAALAYGSQDNWNDQSFLHSLNPGDPITARNYTQKYQYDLVGNIQEMQHLAPGNNWTRTYNYQALNNRLITTEIGAEVYTYQHHPSHGFITEMPHLEEMGWNFKEELVKTIRQRRVDGGTPETTWYQYDGQGQRIRKITENQADPGVSPTKKEERTYITGYEIYKKHSGANSGLERTSLSLIDKGNRFVMIETRNDIDDGTEKQLTRFQLHNHLGSAALELDENTQVISYEEYHPYGTTAFQAKNAAIKSAAKRYRYTGMERDEETGLEYHSARYYINWLGRWLSADPVGIKDGVNIFAYTKARPTNMSDKNGKQSFWEVQADYWSGVGDGAVELGSGLANMVVHPIDTASAIGDNVSRAYDQDGVLGAVNQFNPVYHGLVAGYEYFEALDRGDAREAGRQAFRVATNVVATGAVATGAGGIISGGGTSATATVPTIATRMVPITLSEAPTAIVVPVLSTTTVTIPATAVAASQALGGSVLMMAGNGGGDGPGGGSNSPTPSGGSSTPSRTPSTPPSPTTPAPRATTPRPRRTAPAPTPTAATLSAEAAGFIERAGGLTALANRIKGLGQMSGATVEIALVRLKDGRRVMVAGLNSSATWTVEQLAELRRLGIEIAPQTARAMKRAPHAEENIAAHITTLGGRGERWSHAVVGAEGSYVCSACRSVVRSVGGTIEDGL